MTEEEQELVLARQELVRVVNNVPLDRERLAELHGEVWDTEELRASFVVEGFAAPFVVVRRKADNQRGTLMFQDDPRFYFGFVAVS